MLIPSNFHIYTDRGECIKIPMKSPNTKRSTKKITTRQCLRYAQTDLPLFFINITMNVDKNMAHKGPT